jgi:hypothetical protein
VLKIKKILTGIHKQAITTTKETPDITKHGKK